MISTIEMAKFGNRTDLISVFSEQLSVWGSSCVIADNTIVEGQISGVDFLNSGWIQNLWSFLECNGKIINNISHISGNKFHRSDKMGKKVKIDGKNRITLTVLKDLGVIDEDADEIEIEPNAVTGILFNTDEDLDVIIDSLEAHKRHFETIIKKKEQREKRKSEKSD